MKRNIIVDGDCPVCSSDIEDAWHILVECPFATDVWRLLGYDHVMQRPVHGDLGLWLQELARKLKECEFALVATACHSLWLHRNSILFEGKSSVPNALASNCQSSLLEFWEANIFSTGFQRLDQIQWVPPQQGFLKINFDGAICTYSRRFRVAMVARDNSGKVIWWDAKTLDGSIQPLEVKAWAAQFAADICSKQRWNSVCLEGDNSTVMESLKNGGLEWSSCGHLIASCLELLQSCRDVSSFIKREGNKLAHVLATSFDVHPILNFMLPDVALNII